MEQAYGFPFPFFLNQGGEDPFYREREASLSCKFLMWDCLPQRKKNLKPQNMGSTPLSLIIFQCGIVSHKRKKNPKPQNLGSTMTQSDFQPETCNLSSTRIKFIQLGLRSSWVVLVGLGRVGSKVVLQERKINKNMQRNY